MIIPFFKKRFNVKVKPFKNFNSDPQIENPKKILLNKNKFASDILSEWLLFHHNEIEESTYYGYKMMCPFLQDYFVGVQIYDIDTFAINTFITKMKRNGMTNVSIYNYCRILAMCFDYACVNGYIEKNPVRSACVPKLPRHKEVYPFSVQEVKRLLETDYLQWVKDGIVIAFHTGMRKGEIYALKWSDIDFEQKFIMVQRAQSCTGSKVVLKATKTSCGIRRIDIDKYLVSYLIKMKTNSHSDFVFAPTNKNNQYPYRVPWNISKHVEKMCMMTGIPPRNFHALRHTHATVLLAHGVHSKIVQERLGHSDISITIMTYSHVLPTIQREAVNVFERLCDEMYLSNASEVFDNIIELSGFYFVSDDATIAKLG